MSDKQPQLYDRRWQNSNTGALRRLYRARTRSSLHLLVFFLFLTSFAPSVAQIATSTSKITINVTDVPLRIVLSDISANTEFRFVYSDALVDPHNISCNLTGVSIAEALDTILRPLNIGFELRDAQITLYRLPLEGERHLRGHVYDIQSKEPLPYASVYIRESSYGAVSNADGYFILMDVPTANFEIVVQYLGYKNFAQPVAAGAASEYLKVELHPYLLNAGGVTVTSEENWEVFRVSEGSSELRVAPNHLSLLTSIGEEDVFRSLQLMPGISSESDGSSQLFVRGGTPDQNLVLFDGMTIYYQDHLFGFLSAFNSQALKDIRIYKGGFPAKYGGRTSAVIELSGRSGNPKKPQVGMAVNFLSTGIHATLPIAGKGAVFASYRRSFSDIIKSSLYNKVVDLFIQQDDVGYQGDGEIEAQQVVPTLSFSDFNAKMSLNLSTKDVVSMSVYTGGDDLNTEQDVRLSGDGFPGTNPPLDISEIIDWRSLGASSRWSRVWTEALYSSLLVAFSSYETNFLETGTFRDPGFATFNYANESENRLSNLNVSLDAEWNLSKRHNISAGLALIDAESKYRFVRNEHDVAYDQTFRAREAIAYVQDQFRLNRFGSITGGLRATRYSYEPNYFLEPRLRFDYKIWGDLLLKGAWGHYHQFSKFIISADILQRSEDFWIVANDNIPPEFAEHFVTGIGWQRKGWRIDMEGYMKLLDDLTEKAITFSSGQTLESGDIFLSGSGRARGIELTLHKERGIVTGWIAYAFSRVEHKFPDINAGDYFLAAQDRLHDFKAVIKASWMGWNMSLAWLRSDGNTFTPVLSQYYVTEPDGSVHRFLEVGERNSSRLPAYHRLDLGISRRFQWKKLNLETGFSLFNLYNRKNTWFRRYNYFPNPIEMTDITSIGFTPNVTLKAVLK